MKVGDKVHVEVVGRISDEGIFSAWSLVHFFNIIVVNYIVIVILCICVLLGLCPLSAISSSCLLSIPSDSDSEVSSDDRQWVDPKRVRHCRAHHPPLASRKTSFLWTHNW